MVALLITLFLLQIAREHGIRFFETSAKANINIEKAFLTLAEDILKKVGARWGQGLPAIWIRHFHAALLLLYAFLHPKWFDMNDIQVLV